MTAPSWMSTEPPSESCINIRCMFLVFLLEEDSLCDPCIQSSDRIPDKERKNEEGEKDIGDYRRPVRQYCSGTV